MGGTACALLLLLLLLRADRPRGAELTFELPDSAKQCFYEDVALGVRFSLDYQVRRAWGGRDGGGDPEGREGDGTLGRPGNGEMGTSEGRGWWHRKGRGYGNPRRAGG